MIQAQIDGGVGQGATTEELAEIKGIQGHRSWKQPDRQVAARTVTDAQVLDAVRGAHHAKGAVEASLFGPSSGL